MLELVSWLVFGKILKFFTASILNLADNNKRCQNAKVCFVDKPKKGNKQQSKFERMLGMRYICPGIGEVQLIVGVRKRDKTKIQYCITALTPIIRIKEKSSHK